ncbi:unnamed protein product [Leptidea sinapis]|uniref:Uncharacterized protein n=1 Tax=Leptidea sinapis TaxID=189913 RepID=A0A5E4QQY2_9NEOP|nr:unnamed protein product [Leptidea sinapis]
MVTYRQERKERTGGASPPCAREPARSARKKPFTKQIDRYLSPILPTRLRLIHLLGYTSGWGVGVEVGSAQTGSSGAARVGGSSGGPGAGGQVA